MKNISSELSTVELTPADFDRAADLLTEAFYDNPSHAYIFSNRHSRLKLLKWGLKANLKLNLTPPDSIGKSFALVEGDRPLGTRKIMAMAFWHPPKSRSVKAIDTLKSGWAIAFWKLGRETYRRLMLVLGEMERVKADVLKGNPAWYLNNMAVAQELRGTGVGTRVLTHQLETVVDPSGFPAILMTQKAKNVMFYQKLGFQAIAESEIGEGEDAFTNWCMMRRAN